MILFPFLISLSIGYLTVRLICANKLSLGWQITLGQAIGFGIVGILTFFQLLILNNHSPVLTIGLSTSLLIGLIIINIKSQLPKAPTLHWQHTMMAIAAWAVLAIILISQSTNYPLGGWDAWSCWNLKAKFIYLSPDHWRDMLSPSLWRSNTHYPLLLPSIIAFGWQWLHEPNQSWPMLCAIMFTLSTAIIITTTLLELGVSFAISLILPLCLFSVPLSVMLAISQYSDILVGLYTVCTFSCLLLLSKSPRLTMVCGLLIGLLSFTKTEGLVAAGIMTIISLTFYPACRNKKFLIGLLAGALATLIFQLTIAPSNEAFVNGLTSSLKPSTLERLSVIFIYPWLEIINLKWQGLWIVLIAGFCVFGKNAFGQKQLWPFGIFIVGYLAVVLAYYWVNTFFDITWWLNTTLHRILFALLPTIALWLGLSTKK